MDLIKAARDTRSLLNPLTPQTGGGHYTSFEHLNQMLLAIETEEVADDKAHRWLGWAQGVICCRGEATLEELRRINLLAEPSPLTQF